MNEGPVLVRLREATQTLLDVLDCVHDEGSSVSQALVGGGEFACEQYDLPLHFAPLLEAEAARLLVEHLSLRRVAIFDPSLPERLAALDAMDFEDQLDHLRATAGAYRRAQSTGTVPRRAAAAARSPRPEPAVPSPTSITVPASALLVAQYLLRRR